MQQKVAGFFSALTVIGFSAWFYFEPSFEPAIGFIAGIGGLVHSFWPKSTNIELLNNLNREFGAIKANWVAERELGQPNIDDAKLLLSEVLDFLHDLRIHENSEKLYSEIDELTLEVKQVRSMGIFLDGGVSYQKFWDDGSSAIENVCKVVAKI